MRPAVLLLGLGLFGALAPGAARGRQGNALLAEDAAGAEQAYLAGLTEDDVPAEIGAALWNNLGLARLAQDRAAEADSAFARVLPLAADADQRALAAYNQGTAALAAADLPGAIRALRRALVLRPDYVPAQVNLEIALRRQRDTDAEDEPEPPEPSPFAQRLKAQADSLVAARAYAEASDLMAEGLARDSTVAAFGEFIQRLGDIAEVDSAPLP
ncbi:MAG TPA: hypothetical protein EYQ24_10300 [Bacteroidetes bacterium]|nr:hypothetical protein [Bacteroidota bacterium]